MATRADVELVARGLVKSRSLARRLIDEGAVFTEGPGGEAPITRAAQPVFPDQPLRVAASGASRFVSRGGNKLDAALDAAGIDCTGLDALDVGMSTGGFTHCLLERGARQVLGIEVGHGQLDPQLAADPRVKCLEHTHIRDVQLADLVLPDGSCPRWPPASHNGIPQQDTVPNPAWQPAGAPPGNTPLLPGSASVPAVPLPGFPLIVVDLSFIAARDTSVEEVNKILKEASESKELKGILDYNDKPLVSIDYNHNPASSTFDSTLTKVSGRLVKVTSWYDNEWGFSNRMLDTTVALMNAK